MNDSDKTLSVKFFIHPIENQRKSKEAGRPIFDEVEMVSIMAPGNTKTEFTAFADRIHYDANAEKQWTYAERFSDVYEAFKRGIEEYATGTPISEAPFLGAGLKAELKAKKVRTVEQLASMADRDVAKMGMGFRAHVDAARAYIEKSSGGAALAAEMAELRRQNEALMQRLGMNDEAPVADQFDTMGDEDLVNILTDAGVTVDGRWGRKKLLSELRALSEQTEAA